MCISGQFETQSSFLFVEVLLTLDAKCAVHSPKNEEKTDHPSNDHSF